MPNVVFAGYQTRLPRNTAIPARTGKNTRHNFVFLHTMGTIKDTCFVCKRAVTPINSSINIVVNMPVCNQCKGTEQEKKEEREVLDSLADGFVCGCI